MPLSHLASPSATIAVLRRHGLHTRRSLGQHFLVDGNVVSRILGLAGVGPGDVVLEVGPGIGTLTAALCGQGARVVAVEKDAALLPALAEVSGGSAELAVVLGDALEVSAEELANQYGPPVALVANLPYAVAATVVLRFFGQMPSLRSATVMVQSEVADRMAASPGGKEYGAYTVKLGLLARPSGRFPVSRASFLPPPRVDSAVLRLDRLDRGLAAGPLRDAAGAADAAFSQRRKTIRNSLAGRLSASHAEVEAALACAGVETGVRAETLDVEAYVRLGEALRAANLLP